MPDQAPSIELGRGKLRFDKKRRTIIAETAAVTDEMIEAACVAAYGVGTDKDSNLYKLMKRAIGAALAARRQSEVTKHDSASRSRS